MPKLSIKSFKGLYPSIAPRLLPDGSSQVAIDCDFSSGSLQSFRSPLLTANPGNVNQINTVYLYTDKNGARQWLSFENTVNILRAPIANDTTSRIYYTGDGVPKATDTDQLLQPTPYYQLGVEVPAGTPAVSVSLAGTNTLSRAYAITHVTEWGEESAPSAVSEIVSAGSGSTVELSSIPQSANNTDRNPVTRIYIYRTLSGTTSTALQFLAEIPHGTTTYTDTTEDKNLAKAIKTLDGNEPPSDLFGLISMGNGIMAGFTDYEVCFCEPYQPHSWPNKYKLASVDKIIGGGIFGNRLVVCTDNKPFTVIGSHPDSMSMSLMTDILPCVSAKGIVSMDGGVVFPTPEGLYYIGSGGYRNVTSDQYTEEDWKDLNPEEFTATQWNGKYMAFTSSGGYLFDLSNPNLNTTIGHTGTAVHSDSENKYLYFNSFSGSSNAIYRFHASNYYDVLVWRSKQFFFPKAFSFTCGQVFTTNNGVSSADIESAQALYDIITAANAIVYLSGSLNGAINDFVINGGTINGDDMQDLPTVPPSNSVNIKFYADGNLIHQEEVIDAAVFRMPIVSDAHEFEFEIITPLTVDEINFATSVKEL